MPDIVPETPAHTELTTKSTVNGLISLDERTGKVSKTGEYLAYIVTIGFFLMIAGLFFVQVPTENRDILIQVIGSYGAGWGLVMGYLYVSNKASEERNAARASKER